MDTIQTATGAHAALTDEARRTFLSVLGESGDSRKAAKATRLPRHEWYALRERDAGFAAAWRRAEEQATDALEGEAMGQALNGVTEQIFSHGKKLGRTRKSSEALLIMMLKARRPERYSDKSRGGVSADLRAVLDSINGRTRTMDQDGDE